MSTGPVTLPQAIAKLRAFSEDAFVKATTNAIRRAMSAGRSHAAELLKRSTIGAAVRKKTIPLIVKRGKLELRQDFARGQRSWLGSLKTEGFAALIETGGKTKSHSIKPTRAGGYSRRRSLRAQQLAQGGYLTFQVGGRWVSTKIVTHPGSRIPRSPFMASAAARAEAVLGQELEQGIATAIQKAGL